MRSQFLTLAESMRYKLLIGNSAIVISSHGRTSVHNVKIEFCLGGSATKPLTEKYTSATPRLRS